MKTNISRLGRSVGCYLLGMLVLTVGTAGPVPPPEKLLPDDTLLVLTIPDMATFNAMARQSAEYMFWNDPAMRPFREKFTEKMREQLLAPLERELGVRFDDYTNLIQGQLTFAITQNGWQGRGEPRPALLFLGDAKDKSDRLKKNLADIRSKWIDAGKPIKTEKIRDTEFMVLMLGAEDMPKSLKKFLGPEPRFQDSEGKSETSPDEQQAEPKNEKPKSPLYVGQAGSVLVVGSAPRAIERVLISLGGGQPPTLSDQAVFRANQLAVFRDAHMYCWVNVKAFVDVLLREIKANASAEAEEEESEQMFRRFDPAQAISAIGLGGLRAASFSMRESSEGSLMQFYLDVPEASRTGIFKILAGVPKDCMPPGFVPGDVVKFSRWRIDAQQAWAALEQMLGGFGVFNFILDSASAAAKEADPEFDLKKAVIGNLGDDFISFNKTPRPTDSAELCAGQSLLLVGSPKPDQFIGGLKTLFGAMAQAGGGITEREFLGKKIYSFQVPFLPGADPRNMAARKLSFAASAGYVGFSADPAVLEEFLRSENKNKPLRETPGLTEAAQKVIGPGTTMFEYENQAEQVRILFATLKEQSDSTQNASSASPIPGAELTMLRQWMDFSLLPPYEKVSKYFHFSVSALNTSVDGILLKMFSPVPPRLKKGTD